LSALIPAIRPAHAAKNLAGGAVLAAMASLMAAGAGAAEGKFAGIDLAPTKIGEKSELGDIRPYCGSKPIKVAYSDGFGGNAWKKIARREFEVEAAKCPNITQVTYTDAQGNPERQISDIQSLAAQGYDVIIVFADGGEAIIRAMRQATKAGAAVVPFAVGRDFPGKRGEDYLTTVTDDPEDAGRVLAEWIVKQTGGKGNVLIYGGIPGNTLTIAQQKGFGPVFAKHPGLKVLEGPVDTNWDPAQYQKVTTALLAKFPQVDAIYADYGLGLMGAMRAFKAAGRPIPVIAAQDANELGCFWADNRDANPNFKLGTINFSGPWMTRWALRKGVAAVQGLNNLEPSILTQGLSEDSTSSAPAMMPKCDKSMPPDVLLSNSMLTRDELSKLFAK